jgi:PTS system nitrogen regulatory IIA component
MPEEDFDLMSLADFLHLQPDQVRRMTDRGRLPGRRVGGEWRYSRAEIHQWFENKIGASDERELDEVDRVLDLQDQKRTAEPFEIGQLLQPDCIFVPLNAKTKRSVIDKICEQTALTGRLWEPDKMADALRSREELHPTALENGVALLHPRRPIPGIMGEPFLALGITYNGIPFGGPRGALTDIFFLIGSMNEAMHLRLLSRISRLIQQDEFLEELREAQSPESAWKSITEFDHNLT